VVYLSATISQFGGGCLMLSILWAPLSWRRGWGVMRDKNKTVTSALGTVDDIGCAARARRIASVGNRARRASPAIGRPIRAASATTHT
jgi:hypothetical protein